MSCFSSSLNVFRMRSAASAVCECLRASRGGKSKQPCFIELCKKKLLATLCTNHSRASQVVGRPLALDERMVALAAAITIDYDFFSQHSHSGGWFYPPIFMPTPMPSTPIPTDAPGAAPGGAIPPVAAGDGAPAGGDVAGGFGAGAAGGAVDGGLGAGAAAPPGSSSSSEMHLEGEGGWRLCGLV